MPGPGLMDDYLAGLSAQLPGRIVEELADGLDETYHRYLAQGLDPDAAGRAAVAEFGQPHVIAAAFTDASRGRRTARRLLAAGPAVGSCWAVVLITARAWQWPVPAVVRVLFGVALITVIGLLAAAAFGRHYRSVCPGGRYGLRGYRDLGRGDDRRRPGHRPRPGMACRRSGRSQCGPLRLRPAQRPPRPDQLTRPPCQGCFNDQRHVPKPMSAGLPVCPRVTVTVPERPPDRAARRCLIPIG
jgi:hypothetical protein